MRVIPKALFVAMEGLYPRVCVDIKLCGQRSDCQKILTDYSGFHAVNLACLREEGQSELKDRVNVDITCLLRQSSLTKLRVVFNYGWQFRLPQVEANYKRLSLRELDFESDEVPEQQIPAYRLLLRFFVDLDALKVLRLRKYWLIALVLNDPCISNHKLERVSIRGEKPRPSSRSLTVQQHASIANFFSATALREINLYDIMYDILWLDLVSTSGSGLLQLSVHTTYDDWWSLVTHSQYRGNNNSPFRIKRRLGVTHDELHKLVTLCPNIERLGIDIQGVSVTAAVSLGLRNLGRITCSRARFLDRPYWDNDVLISSVEDPIIPVGKLSYLQLIMCTALWFPRSPAATSPTTSSSSVFLSR